MPAIHTIPDPMGPLVANVDNSGEQLANRVLHNSDICWFNLSANCLHFHTIINNFITFHLVLNYNKNAIFEFKLFEIHFLFGQQNTSELALNCYWMPKLIGLSIAVVKYDLFGVDVCLCLSFSQFIDALKNIRHSTLDPNGKSFVGVSTSSLNVMHCT